MSGWRLPVTCRTLMFVAWSAPWLSGCGGTRPQAIPPHPPDSGAVEVAAPPSSGTRPPPDVSTSGEVIGKLAANGAVISLVRRDCAEDCALSVASEGGSGRGALTLSWRVPVGPIRSVGEETSPDVFVLGPSPRGVAWTIGEEESAATIAVAGVDAPGPASFLLLALALAAVASDRQTDEGANLREGALLSPARRSFSASGSFVLPSGLERTAASALDDADV
jgi:hypothetical protein